MGRGGEKPCRRRGLRARVADEPPLDEPVAEEAKFPGMLSAERVGIEPGDRPSDREASPRGP